MRKIFLLMFVFINQLVYSQDIIFTHEVDSITCKVLEIGENSIIFKKLVSENVDSISTSFVSYIKFENGTIQEFSDKRNIAINVKKDSIQPHSDKSNIESFKQEQKKKSLIDFGVSLGAGSWWAISDNPDTKSEIAPTFNVGIFFEKKMGCNFSLRTDLDFKYLMRNYSYKTVVNPDYLIVIGESESATGYYQLSLPIQIGYIIGKIKPYFGIEYSYRFSEPWANKKYSNLSMNIGINYLYSRKHSFAITYNKGLTTDFVIKGLITDPFTSETIGDYNYRWKSYSLNLSYFYIFN